MNEKATPIPPTIPDEVEILKKYTADPHCKACHGKGRIGINHIIEKGRDYYQLQLCYCVIPVESEYMRLVKRIDEFEKLMERRDEAMRDLVILRSYVIDRHTAGYWVNKFCEKLVEVLQKLMPWKKGGLVK